MNNFKVGDSVQLKIGSFGMTVEFIDGDDITCVWSENKTIRRDSFKKDALKEFISGIF